ncbi:hypothetical protein [Herbaspirillum robiniae]|uniref:Uncharacterized protein n=1 Tax=Herbaspirillum robiniae TaxID=2014887 RepID=A0ABX2M8C2_9BURK|nr:hypothetical protein [Herbaspirillum robiniae]NUU04031.1 hypothetical protein [Herbaspirillum robiniae]
MRLEIQNKAAKDNPSEQQLRRAILSLRSYGTSSFASLTDDHGSYLQVAGGGITCLLERRDAFTGVHYRAYQEKKNTNYPDGTLLVFGAGEVALLSDEWFSNTIVADVFAAFLLTHALPENVHWRVARGI